MMDVLAGAARSQKYRFEPLNDRQMRPVREIGRERDDILTHAADTEQDGLDIPKALNGLSPHVAKADKLLVFQFHAHLSDYARSKGSACAKGVIVVPRRGILRVLPGWRAVRRRP